MKCNYSKGITYLSVGGQRFYHSKNYLEGLPKGLHCLQLFSF